MFLLGCNYYYFVIYSYFFAHSFFIINYRLRLLGRTPPHLEFEEQHAEKVAGKEENAEKEEPRSAESDRSSKGVYYNSNFLSDINSTE